MLSQLRKTLVSLLLLGASTQVFAQQGTISEPADGTAIAPGATFDFSYNARSDYGVESFDITVWLFTGPPDTSSLATFLTGHFFGRWSSSNTNLGESSPNPPPAQLTMPDFSKDQGMANGLSASDVTLYFVVLEEYGTFTPTLGLDMALSYVTVVYNATSGGGGGSSSGTKTIRPGADQTKCLTADYNGDPVTIETCTGAADQQWTYSGPGQSTSISLFGPGPQALCLDVTNGNTFNGNVAQVWSCTEGDTNQVWWVTADNRIAWEGKGECLDLTNGDTTAGIDVQMWTCADGDANQVWYFV